MNDAVLGCISLLVPHYLTLGLHQSTLSPQCSHHTRGRHRRQQRTCGTFITHTSVIAVSDARVSMCQTGATVKCGVPDWEPTFHTLDVDCKLAHRKPCGGTPKTAVGFALARWVPCPHCPTVTATATHCWPARGRLLGWDENISIKIKTVIILHPVDMSRHARHDFTTQLRRSQQRRKCNGAKWVFHW